ncbi:hypothetical protein FQN54_006558 [Arachnomyces sp. PD_36]|nr:hypothetical protein FQN54_006558 [Arachnomyces sp. PD_36]
MPVTGVYFVPSSANSTTALASITERLRSTYDPVPIGRWGLEHKLMRDTHSCLPASAYSPLPALQPRFMQFLNMTHYTTHGFVYTSDRPHPDPWADPSSTKTGPGVSSSPTPTSTQSTTIPPSSQSSAGAVAANNSKNLHPPEPLPMKMMTPDPTSFISWFQISLRACEPLWSHRHTVAVQAGVVFEVADFRVRVGDVRQTFPVTRIRGTVIEIEYCGPGAYSNTNDDEVPGDGQGNTRPPVVVTMEDWEIGEVLIREFWERLGISGGREAIRVPDVAKEVREAEEERGRNPGKEMKDRKSQMAGVDLARQYMEVFRFNR